MTDGNVNFIILTISVQMTINISKNLKDAFVFTVAFQSIPKFSGISKKKPSLKFCSSKSADAGLQIYFIVDVLLEINFIFIFINISQRSIQDPCKHLRLRNLQ